MSENFASIKWSRNDHEFLNNRYSRAHTWEFDGGAIVPASSSPHVVPLPLSDESAVDPEEAFVAALSSCHMLFFLSIAAKRKFVVDDYSDHAIGVLEKDTSGKTAMTRVTLRPKVSFSGDKLPAREDLATLHRMAHEQCFIANSVTTEVRVEPES